MASFRNEKTFRIFNYLFTFACIPLYNVPNSFVYNIFVTIVLFSYLSLTLSLVMNVYLHFDDLDKAIDAIIFLPPMTLGICTYIYFRFRRRNFVRLMIFTDHFTWEDLPPVNPLTGSASMKVWIHRIKSVTVNVSIFGIGIHTIQTIIRMILSEERLLSIDAWYPYDWSKSPAYELTNITQFIATAGLCATLYAFPTFYATLIVIGCSQLEKLGINLSNIKQKHISAMIKAGDDDLLQLEKSQRMYAHMQQELNKCIRLHQVIIRFTKELEDIFSTFFVGVFLILMLSLCFASYTAVLRWGSPVNVLQSVQAYTMYLIFIFLICWFPSEFSNQIEKVREAAWDCDWVGAPVPFQRSLSFVIAIANKELVFTVGRCVPVSKETMMSMIQESFSLFMFLLQVRQRKEKEGQMESTE